MKQAFASPGKYIQGDGVLSMTGDLIRTYGHVPYVLMGQTPDKQFGARIDEMCRDLELSRQVFSGYVSYENVGRYQRAAEEHGGDVIVAVGGGRCIDAGKLIAHALRVPLIIVPTVASTDAPTSALAVIYSEEGAHICEEVFPDSPNVVLVDTEIIAQTPARLLVAGMGDALATYFEARACIRSGSDSNISGFRQTRTSQAIAESCYRTLLERGAQALEDAKAHRSTDALRDIVEVNTLMSGVGAESNGASGAHAFHDGFTTLKETAAYYHGEIVSFGLLCQLVLENTPQEEIREVRAFQKQVGLPMTLSEIGIRHKDENTISRAAEAVLASPLIRKEPFAVTKGMIEDAIIVADAIGSGD